MTSTRVLVRAAFIAGLWALAGCSGGGSGSDAPGNPVAPLQPLRSLELLAGSLEAGGCGDVDGSGTAARLNPMGPLAVDSQGHVALLEEALWLRTISPQGVVGRELPHTGGAPQDIGDAIQFYLALPALAIGPDDARYTAAARDLRRPPNYASEPSGWVIFRRGADGAESLHADPARQAVPLQVGNTIGAMAFDRRGRLLVADTQACAVRRVEADRSVTTAYTAFAVAGQAACQAVHALAVDADDGWAYALSDGTVRRRSAQGVERTVAGLTVGTRVSLAFDGRGRLFVSDRDARRVWVEDVDGSVTVRLALAAGPERPQAVNQPTGLATDRAGQVLLADRGNCTVSRLEADGRVTVLAGMAPQNGFRDGPGAQARFGPGFRIAADRQGNVFVSDPGNRVLRRIDAAGNTATIAGTPDPGLFDGTLRPRGAADQIWEPGAVAALADGRVLLADAPDLLVAGPGGRVDREAGVVLPVGLSSRWTLLAAGQVGEWVRTEGELQGCIRCEARSLFTFWRRLGGAAPEKLLDQDSSPLLREGAARAALPSGLAVGADGSVWFTLAHAVYRRDAAGTITRVAGGAEAGLRDGAGAEARFNLPGGLALDAGAPGVVYVADTANHRVRRIGPDGAVSTVLGTPDQAVNRPGAAPAALRWPREVQVVPGGLVIATEAAVLRARE